MDPQADVEHRFVLVGDDNTFRVVRLTASSRVGTVDETQALVDGYFEFIAGQVSDPAGRVLTLSLWVNEDGRLRPDLAPNVASLALTPQRVSPVVGAVVVTRTDANLDTVGLTDTQLDAVTATLRTIGVEELPDTGFADAAERQRGIYAQRPQREQ